MTQERAVLAGGCFWGMQDLIRRHDGVISTRVGYTGGDVPNATYRNLYCCNSLCVGAATDHGHRERRCSTRCS
jgi:peptide methionine sulfoxide reductase MsrA